MTNREDVLLYIDMVLFLVANCSLIPKMYKQTTTPAHEYQAQTVAGVFKVVLPVKMNLNVLTKIV
jgi:hypothetical protein